MAEMVRVICGSNFGTSCVQSPNRSINRSSNTLNLHDLLVFRREDAGLRLHRAQRSGVCRASIQPLRNVPRTVKDADDVQPARRGDDAVENQIIREPPHRPEMHPGQSGAVGLVARADFRPLRQRAKAQTQRIQKPVGGGGIVRRDEQMNVRHVADRFPGADDFKRLQVA